jgi:hypothetical protein
LEDVSSSKCEVSLIDIILINVVEDDYESIDIMGCKVSLFDVDFEDVNDETVFEEGAFVIGVGHIDLRLESILRGKKLEDLDDHFGDEEEVFVDY